MKEDSRNDKCGTDKCKNSSITINITIREDNRIDNNSYSK